VVEASRWFWPFGPSRARVDGEKLVGTITQISRQPGFFGEGRVSDTLEGRLELLTLNACLVLIRLGQDSNVATLGQAFTDILFRHIDAGLREAAVSDQAVPRRMRRIASSFYGRLGAYSTAIAAHDAAALEAALARNVFAVEPGQNAFAARLATYAMDAAKAQSDAPVETLFRLDGWPAAPG
jgi:cytochrome b pre-mRNA-processing protein 3